MVGRRLLQTALVRGVVVEHGDGEVHVGHAPLHRALQELELRHVVDLRAQDVFDLHDALGVGREGTIALLVRQLARL